MDILLKLTIMDQLPKKTDVYQTDNGTFLYLQEIVSPVYRHRLCVKWKGNEIEAKLPTSGMLDSIIAFRNAVYFATTDKSISKVYKAVLSMPNGIKITHMRDGYEGETFEYGGICRRVKNGKTYIYRLFDEPENDGIMINTDDKVLEGMWVGGFLRIGQKIPRRNNVRNNVRIAGKVVYMGLYPGETKNSAHEYKGMLIIKTSTAHARVYASDSSPFIYISRGRKLLTLDTDSMKFVGYLHLGNFKSISAIVGVHNGEITVKEYTDSKEYLVTAQLPKAHEPCEDCVSTEKKRQEVSEKYEELNQKYNEMTVQHYEMKDRIESLERKYRKALIMLGRKEEVE